MKKYYFILENCDGISKISGHAYTLRGVKRIFKKVTNASTCTVYKKRSNFCFKNIPLLRTKIVTYYK